MARAAAVMASLTRLPDLRILVGLGVNNLAGGRRLPVYPFLFDPRSQVGEALMVQETVFDDARSPDVFFVGGFQVDRRGNINLFGIPDGDGGWKLRGPGGVALTTMSTNCAGYYIVMQRHDPRTFVERVDLITALGDRAERERLRLPGGGPRFVLSPLGVFDFDEEGDMKIRSLHEGVSLEQVREATGFELGGGRGAADHRAAERRGAGVAARAGRRRAAPWPERARSARARAVGGARGSLLSRSVGVWSIRLIAILRAPGLNRKTFGGCPDPRLGSCLARPPPSLVSSKAKRRGPPVLFRASEDGGCRCPSERFAIEARRSLRRQQNSLHADRSREEGHRHPPSFSALSS